MKKNLFSRKTFIHVNHKILLAFFVIVLIIYSIGLYINIRLQNEIRKSFINTIKSKVDYISIELNSRLENIDSLITYTITRYNVRKMALYSQSNTLSDMLDDMRSVRQILISLTSSNSLVSQAEIFLPELGFKISSFNYKVEFDEDDRELLSYIGTLQQMNKFIIWDDKVYMVSTIFSPNDRQNDCPAALIVELSNSAFYQYASSASFSDETEVMLIVNNRLIINDSSLEGHYKDMSISELLMSAQSMEEDSLYKNISIEGSPHLVLNQMMDNYDINIVSISDPEAITRNINQPQTWSLMFTIIAGLAFVSFLFIVNHLVTRPIKKINETIEILEHDHILEFKYDKNELTSLYQAFNKLIGRFKGAIEQVYNNKLIAQQAEMKYLQAQINPHFLYNSFFHLYRMSKMENLDGVAEMSNKLGRYYQYITRSASSIVPFEMEYANAKDYTDIQTIRFGGKITVVFDELKEEYKNILTPKFILQPIIENAYNHGLEMLSSGGMIKIGVTTDAKDLIVTIEDNGGGVNASKINDISNYLDTKDDNTEITGMKNTRIRLHSYGGEMKIESNENGGLKVTLNIPLEKNLED